MPVAAGRRASSYKQMFMFRVAGFGCASTDNVLARYRIFASPARGLVKKSSGSGAASVLREQ
jgi:hypothetical protein